MRYYIFLTTSIARVGGAQLYIARKSQFLIENGWNVIIYHYVTGPVMINYDKRIKTELIYELGCSPTLFYNQHLDKVLGRLTNLGNTDEIVIESHTINLAYWGEIINSKIGGKHLIYLLSERLPKVSDSTYRYLEFKYQQKSLFGITPVSLKQLFTSLGENFAFLNAIGCTSNNVDNIPNETMDNFKKSDWNILSIGRLDKDYIIPTFNSLAEYANKHKDKSISIIIVGGSYRKYNHKNAILSFKNCKNVSIIDVGYVWPIPISCFYNSDVTIASSGSAVIAESTGAPVIVIDGKDLQPIGIYKRTTNSFVFRAPEEPPIMLSSLLDDILINKKYIKEIHFETNKILDFSSHMTALNQIDSKTYPLNELFRSRESITKKIVISILGARCYAWIFKFQSRIKKKINN